jgi:hypothetical protein
MTNVKPPRRNTDDYYRAAFLLCGLPWGRDIGSTSAYTQAHPARFLITNASVITSDRVCVWRGDLDLAVKEDGRSLVSASKLLHRKLHVLREISDREVQSLPYAWLRETAVATVWQGKIQSAGYYRRIYGTVDQIIARYRSLVVRG